jgi:hypothetical protein
MVRGDHPPQPLYHNLVLAQLPAVEDPAVELRAGGAAMFCCHCRGLPSVHLDGTSLST